MLKKIENKINTSLIAASLVVVGTVMGASQGLAMDGNDETKSSEYQAIGISLIREMLKPDENRNEQKILDIKAKFEALELELEVLKQNNPNPEINGR